MSSTSKSVIVTGAASGIGAACARLLAAAGHRVALCDRDAERGQSLADSLAAEGLSACFVPVDVCDEGSVKRAVASAVSTYGCIDAAINSAGIEQAAQPLHELDAADWDRGHAINLRGMFLCLKHEIAAMLPTGGAIVALSSAAALKGLPSSADYCSAKAGVLGLVRAAAVDYAEQGIRVNALLPGGTDTPLAHRSSAANPTLGRTLYVPMARMAAPEEIAAAAIWLVSDASSYVTGAAIAADGGMTIA